MARNAHPIEETPVSQRITIPTPMPAPRKMLVDAGVYRFVRHEEDEDELTPPSTRRV